MDSEAHNERGNARQKIEETRSRKALTRNPSALIHESETSRQMGIIARSNGPYFSPISVVSMYLIDM